MQGEGWLEAGECWPGPSAFLLLFIIPNSHPNQCDAVLGGLCYSFWFCNMFKTLDSFQVEECPQTHGLTHTSIYGGS